MKELLTKLKSRGYWQFIIRPSLFNESTISTLDICHQLIRENKVSLRGWDFPHYPDYSRECTNNVGFIECGIDWSYFVEYWRFYQSAQFVFLKGFWEDWNEQAEELFTTNKKLKPNTVIDLLYLVYTLTECFEFAARLASRGILGNSCVIEVSLHNCKNRQLITLDPGRHLFATYTCNVDTIPYKIEIKSDEILRDPALLARKAMHFIFKLFNWMNVGINQFQKEQVELLKRRR